MIGRPIEWKIGLCDTGVSTTGPNKIIVIAGVEKKKI
jgi:hypothetical protein